MVVKSHLLPTSILLTLSLETGVRVVEKCGAKNAGEVRGKRLRARHLAYLSISDIHCFTLLKDSDEEEN